MEDCRISASMNLVGEKKDALKLWEEMKMNGFVSTSLGRLRIPTPTKNNNKSKSLGKKKPINKVTRIITKAQKVNNRYIKAAPPTALLDEFSPGIIAHVRSSKQVRSILEAILGREEKVAKKDSQSAVVDECLDSLSQVGEEIGCSAPLLTPLHMPSQRIEPEKDNEFNSSVPIAVENVTSVSNEELAKPAGVAVSSIPETDATVSSQWLQLLEQDITRRLAALNRSRMRVQEVIETELPFILSKEFQRNQEGDPSAAGCPSAASRDMHQQKWNSLFNQMVEGLSEEAVKLEIWLKQVRETQQIISNGQAYQDCVTRLMAADIISSHMTHICSRSGGR